MSATMKQQQRSDNRCIQRSSRLTLSNPRHIPTTYHKTPELRVWNAKTLDAEPVARVKLPTRVPVGFQALFVSEAELANQTQEQDDLSMHTLLLREGREKWMIFVYI